MSRITSLNSAFANAPTFNANLYAWNVEKVTSMAYTFFSAATFNADI